MRLDFTDLALEDLASIEEYTRNNWGAQQADIYVSLIEQGISNILENPELGKKRPDIAEECRYIPEHEHLIFYRIEDDKIIILAIPHGSMENKNYLHRDHDHQKDWDDRER